MGAAGANAFRDHAGRERRQAIELFDRAAFGAQATPKVIEDRQYLLRIPVGIFRPRAVREKLAQLLLVPDPTAPDFRERGAKVSRDFA